MENVGQIQRFQVKISGQWNDYNQKEDEVLKAAFDNFIRKSNDKTVTPQDHFKELVIKGRRYIVDFHKMVQVRKDNKKDYKVRPPTGLRNSASQDGSQDAQQEQGLLILKCEQCQRTYTLREFEPRLDGEDWADCRYCQDCWRPFLDREKQVEERKVEKTQKQRPVQQPFRVSISNGEKTTTSSAPSQPDKKQQIQLPNCGYCGKPLGNDEAVFLGACEKRQELCLCHDECGKNDDPDAQALAKLYSIEYPKFLNSMLSQYALEAPMIES
jgi:hypothetical protein